MVQMMLPQQSLQVDFCPERIANINAQLLGIPQVNGENIAS
jgi:hypothetical protein